MVGIAVDTMVFSTAAMNVAIMQAASVRPRRRAGVDCAASLIDFPAFRSKRHLTWTTTLREPRAIDSDHRKIAGYARRVADEGSPREKATTLRSGWRWREHDSIACRVALHVGLASSTGSPRAAASTMSRKVCQPMAFSFMNSSITGR